METELRYVLCELRLAGPTRWGNQLNGNFFNDRRTLIRYVKIEI
ncbi:MAG: hypothetical protein RLZZ435_2146 [Cyanobacteriota bacterium]|jgi:hypothetical protein